MKKGRKRSTQNESALVISSIVFFAVIFATASIWIAITDTQEHFLGYSFLAVYLYLFLNKMFYYIKLADKSEWSEIIVILCLTIIIAIISYIINSKLPFISLAIFNMLVLIRELLNKKVDKNKGIKVMGALYITFLFIIGFGSYFIYTT